MTYEIRFRAKHDCPFLEFANTFENLSLFGYCSREFDVMMVPGRLKIKNIRAAKKLFQNFDQWKISTGGTESNTTYMKMDCECSEFFADFKESITTQILKRGGMLKYPIIYDKGWENYRIICLDKSIVSKIIELIQTLPTWEIVATEDMGEFGFFKSQMLSVQEIIGNLTVHQANIMIKAYEGGYYDIPRRIRIQDIADEIEISRYGVEKVLRAAENKIVESTMPYLYFKSDSN